MTQRSTTLGTPPPAQPPEPGPPPHTSSTSCHQDLDMDGPGYEHIPNRILLDSARREHLTHGRGLDLDQALDQQKTTPHTPGTPSCQRRSSERVGTAPQGQVWEMGEGAEAQHRSERRVSAPPPPPSHLLSQTKGTTPTEA